MTSLNPDPYLFTYPSEADLDRVPRDEDLYERFQQRVEVTERGHQRLLTFCPQCQKVYLFSTEPGISRTERSRPLLGDALVSGREHFLANLGGIPRRLCALCSFNRYGGEYQVLEQHARGRHIGFLFRFTSVSGPHTLIQLRRYLPGDYDLLDVRDRYPLDGVTAAHALLWLQKIGIRRAHDRPPHDIQGVTRLGQDLLRQWSYDIYDGLPPPQPLHWEGWYYRTTMTNVYQTPTLMSLALSTATRAGTQLSLYDLTHLVWLRLHGFYALLDAFPL